MASSPRLADLRAARPVVWVELFAAANLAFLAVDIFIAHSINRFAEPAEWVPLAFSLASTPLLVAAMALGGSIAPVLRVDEAPGTLGGQQRLARWIGLAVGWASVAVGVAGLLFHLESQFFARQTLKNLVYTAPFAAPLAYAGIGLLLIMDRMVDPRSVEWARWVILLALGGFVGNFVLTLADHAQNGFFNPSEWIGVIAAALAVGALLAVLIVHHDPLTRRVCLATMGVQVVVGLLGAYFHGAANLAKHSGTLWERFLYGAPIFAPLLFANLAVLAALGLWALADAAPVAPRITAPEPS